MLLSKTLAVSHVSPSSFAVRLQSVTKDAQEPPEFIQALDEHCLLHMAYWGEQVTRTESTAKAPGSVIQQLWEELEAQQEPLLDLNVAVLAWRSIASAGEHLGLAHRVHQTTKGGVVPRPQMSLARGALLSAARAIYLLQPDSAIERNVRAAQLANQEVKDAGDFLQVWAAIDEDGELATDLEQTSTYFNALKSAAQNRLVAAGRKPDSRMGETALLKAVAPVLADGMEHPEFGVMSAWRKGSGAAHGRSWVWGALPDGLHPAEEFVAIWSVPVGLMGHAWTLWNQRRESEMPPAYPPPGWDVDPSVWAPPDPVSRPFAVGAKAVTAAAGGLSRLLGTAGGRLDRGGRQ